MSRWLARVDDLLFDGERVETEVEVDEGAVVVTSHRVLAFTPEAEGSNYDYVDRPNAVGVERTTRGTASYLFHAVKALLVGGILLAAGQLVSLDDVVGGIELGTTGGMGLSGFLGMMRSLLGLLAMLDELMTAGGALVLLASAALLGAYVLTREDLLVVEVSGDDDVELPAGEATDDVADRLDRAIRPGGDDGGERPPDEGDGPPDTTGDPLA